MGTHHPTRSSLRHPERERRATTSADAPPSCPGCCNLMHLGAPAAALGVGALVGSALESGEDAGDRFDRGGAPRIVVAAVVGREETDWRELPGLGDGVDDDEQVDGADGR